MNKAVAVPYVIAIILGIIVIGIIGYWFFVLYGGGGGQASEQFCRYKEHVYCSEWSRNAYGDMPFGGKLFSSACPAEDTYAPECCSYAWASSVSKSECTRILAQNMTVAQSTTGGGTPPSPPTGGGGAESL